MSSTKWLAILAIAAILVMGAGTFVIMGGLQIGQPAVQQSTVQGRITAFVVPSQTTTTGHVTVTVLPH